MRNTDDKSDSKDIRQTILEAAESRFRHYGYNKTTMAEIAEDTSMSAANIYRYFTNKQDIVAACANRYVNERIEVLRNTIRQTNKTAIQQLEDYALTTLQFSQEMASSDNKVNQLVNTIAEQSLDLVQNRIDSEIGLITEILEHGKNSGEFIIDDVTKTAQSVHAALIIFDVPVFMNLYPQKQFKDLAKSVVQMITKSLTKE